jgi:hypothetical protein
MWTGFSWHRCGAVAGSFEHGNRASLSIRIEEFLD